MKAVVIHKYGGVETLEHADVPAPTITPGHIIIRIEAVGVNPIDWKIRKGEMKMMVRAPFPIILGGEVAGVVTEVASDVTRFKVGDKVFSMVPGELGGYAELISVPETVAAQRPNQLDAVQGASVLVGAVTALQSLRDKGELKAGQRLLVNGASGCVGLFAVQLGVELGATVTAVCSEAKFDMAKAAGASECIDYKKSDFTKLGKKWDLIFDAVATRHFSNCHEALEPHGIYVTTISSGGDMAAPLLNPVRSQKSRFILMKPNAPDVDYVRGLVEAGKLKATVGGVFPLERIVEAQTLAESGKANGKIVITVS
jgi:NADPH:quinone reductase-like Zn-dependent oxidoreductase